MSHQKFARLLFLKIRFDSRSLVENVNLVNIDNMNDLKILEKDTQMDLQKNSKLYKINIMILKTNNLMNKIKH